MSETKAKAKVDTRERLREAAAREINENTKGGDGHITPDGILDAAAANPRKWPAVTKYLEWNNETAGRLYRIEQIKGLLRYKIEMTGGEVRTLAPQAVSLRPHADYQRTDTLIEIDRVQLLREELEQVKRYIVGRFWMPNAKGAKAELLKAIEKHLAPLVGKAVPKK